MIDPPCHLDERAREGIARLLVEHGWSRDELQACTGIPKTRFQACMDGKQSFELNDVWNIGKELGVSFDQLVRDPEDLS
ncbi:helix-turn-helix domain-containing protein [Actinomyces minihominis]|uniref:helix-turn-helix domain-containing protein n=1 Tax=Actinomyces minihominis TaxID=2002838 RepID=UPI000C08B0B1|nr:helix-turn-helix transcriptional regulator [Actinomyces minihominis]